MSKDGVDRATAQRNMDILSHILRTEGKLLTSDKAISKVNEVWGEDWGNCKSSIEKHGERMD